MKTVEVTTPASAAALAGIALGRAAAQSYTTAATRARSARARNHLRQDTGTCRYACRYACRACARAANTI